MARTSDVTYTARSFKAEAVAKPFTQQGLLRSLSLPLPSDSIRILIPQLEAGFSSPGRTRRPRPSAPTPLSPSSRKPPPPAPRTKRLLAERDHP